MSTQSTVLNTGQQAIINTDTSKVFLWNRRSQKESMTNSTYDPITYPIGTVMGRITSTGKIVPLTSGASNGSQYPVGILEETYVIEDGTTVDVFICDDGDVDDNKIVLQGSDTLATVVAGRTLRDWIKAQGIKLIPTTEMTDYDNS
jgi:hypothetical protein